MIGSMSDEAKSTNGTSRPADWLAHTMERSVVPGVYLMHTEQVPAAPTKRSAIPPETDRALMPEEYELVRWMLEHGDSKARSFPAQLEVARVTSWRCSCGCASFHFRVEGDFFGVMSGVLAGFQFGTDKDLKGIFVWESNGVLGGVELVGYTGDASRVLPVPDELRCE
jgi:hypothetical protein